MQSVPTTLLSTGGIASSSSTHGVHINQHHQCCLSPLSSTATAYVTLIIYPDSIRKRLQWLKCFDKTYWLHANVSSLAPPYPGLAPWPQTGFGSSRRLGRSFGIAGGRSVTMSDQMSYVMLHSRKIIRRVQCTSRPPDGHCTRVYAPDAAVLYCSTVGCWPCCNVGFTPQREASTFYRSPSPLVVYSAVSLCGDIEIINRQLWYQNIFSLQSVSNVKASVKRVNPFSSWQSRSGSGWVALVWSCAADDHISAIACVKSCFGRCN